MRRAGRAAARRALLTPARGGAGARLARRELAVSAMMGGVLGGLA